MNKKIPVMKLRFMTLCMVMILAVLSTAGGANTYSQQLFGVIDIDHFGQDIVFSTKIDSSGDIRTYDWGKTDQLDEIEGMGFYGDSQLYMFSDEGRIGSVDSRDENSKVKVVLNTINDFTAAARNPDDGLIWIYVKKEGLRIFDPKDGSLGKLKPIIIKDLSGLAWNNSGLYAITTPKKDKGNLYIWEEESGFKPICKDKISVPREVQNLDSISDELKGEDVLIWARLSIENRSELLWHIEAIELTDCRIVSIASKPIPNELLADFLDKSVPKIIKILEKRSLNPQIEAIAVTP